MNHLCDMINCKKLAVKAELKKFNGVDAVIYRCEGHLISLI